MSFCYSKRKENARIFIDGEGAVPLQEKTYSYSRTGFVTIFSGGHHKDDSAFAALKGDNTLWSMELVDWKEGMMPPNRSLIPPPINLTTEGRCIPACDMHEWNSNWTE